MLDLIVAADVVSLALERGLDVADALAGCVRGLGGADNIVLDVGVFQEASQMRVIDSDIDGDERDEEFHTMPLA